LKDGKDLRNMDIYYAFETLRTVKAFEIKQKRSRETRVSMGGCIEETCEQEYIKQENERVSGTRM
jgi:hypothetical protein